MLEVDRIHYLTQLERIIVELRNGRSVLLTCAGKPFQELIAPGADEATQGAIIKHNHELGWLDWRGSCAGLLSEGKPVAIVKWHIKCSKFTRYRLILDDILTNPLVLYRYIDRVSRDQRTFA